MTTTVVNLKSNQHDVYIGRKKGLNSGQHFGNPFSHNPDWGIACVSREASILAYEQWLDGTGHENVEPERRLWILKNIHCLMDKSLGCFCKPLACHGDVLKKYADRLDDNLKAILDSPPLC